MKRKAFTLISGWYARQNKSKEIGVVRVICFRVFLSIDLNWRKYNYPTIFLHLLMHNFWKSCCMIQNSLALIYSKKSADQQSDMCSSALMCLVKKEMFDFVLLNENLQIQIKRSQYAGAYSFGFFIDVFGDSLLLSHLL